MLSTSHHHPLSPSNTTLKQTNNIKRRERRRRRSSSHSFLLPTVPFLLFLLLLWESESRYFTSASPLKYSDKNTKQTPMMKGLVRYSKNAAFLFRGNLCDGNHNVPKRMIASSSSMVPFLSIRDNVKLKNDAMIRQQKQSYFSSYHHEKYYYDYYKGRNICTQLHMSYTTSASASSRDKNKEQNSTSENIRKEDDDDDDDEENDGMDEEELYDNGNDDEDPSTSILSTLPEGKPKGFYIISQYTTPSNGFTSLSQHYSLEDMSRLGLSPDNVTLPVALTLLDPVEYPSLSRARKACRKGAVLIHRGSLGMDEETGEESVFDPDKCIRGRVADRVYPQDVIGKQVRMGTGCYPVMPHLKPPFDLPIIYEDDHFAIVNKPAGVVVYSHRKGGHGRMTVRAALPFVLRPPAVGTMATIRRPQAVHRLDKPTSGLLLIAKTKPAMVDLTRQFVERNIKKTYTAIVNGIPDEPTETSISSLEAHELGVDIDIPDNDDDDDTKWQIIDYTLDEKSAVTVWRPLRYSKSLKGVDNYVTLVELKPKTGRFHQLRRHMAWVCNTPVIGDSEYDHLNFKDQSLYLCSNKVTLDHPYYNTKVGRKEWEAMDDGDDKKYGNGMIRLSEDEDDDGRRKVQVHASIELPEKFMKFLDRSEERAKKFLDTEEST